MPPELVSPTAADTDTLGDICYRAFKDISERHGFPSDFASPEFAHMVIGSLIRDETIYGVAARLDGRLVGSNFIELTDGASGIGPVSVDPAAQSGGVGRAMMEDVLRHARESGIERVRLMQDSFNMTSLALYASLGFDTKAPVAMMEPAPAESPNVRRATRGDLDGVEELSRRIYRVNRRHSVEAHLSDPFTPFVFEKGGRVTAYFVPGIFGHGAGESEEEMAELVLHTFTQAPPMVHVFFCPLTEGSLYRRFLAAGCRNRKVMNLMTLGPYEEPQGVWLPSVGY